MTYYYRDPNFNWSEQKPLFMKKWKQQVARMELELDGMISGSRESNRLKDKLHAVRAKIKKHS